MQTSNYQDLKVWRKSIQLCKEIYGLLKNYPREETFGISSQMRRAVVSIPSNIAEGHARNTPKEFLKFLSIAKGSAAELETQCIVSLEIGLISEELLRQPLTTCIEVRKMLNSLYNAIQKRLDPVPPTTNN
ncbi:MAG: four helix bundle protein [Bacteroidales bacterium]|nr:four helix bundle protein [Bacteroidales bacterium]